MEKDRGRRQTPSVHPGSRKPLISMDGAGLREGGEGQKWMVADEEGYLLTENDLRGSPTAQDTNSETKGCRVLILASFNSSPPTTAFDEKTY